MPIRTSEALAGVTRSTTLMVCTASIVLTWWLSSLGRHHGSFYVIGPFHVPVLLEWAIGMAVLAAACVARARSARRGTTWSRYSRVTVLLLVVTSVLTTGGWRAITSRGEGANIGGGLLLLIGPLLIAGLLQLALNAERVARSGQLRHFAVTTIAIWAVGACVTTWLLP